MLESESQSESELLGVGRSHTAAVEVLGILAVELGIGVEQAQVGGSQLERAAVETHEVQECLGHVVGERNLLEADEVALGHACCRVVVGTVGTVERGVEIVLATRCNGRDVGISLIAWHHPAVLELLGHSHLVAVGRGEYRVEAQLVATRVGDEHVEMQALPREVVAKAATDGGIDRTFIFQVAQLLILLEVEAYNRDVAVLVDALGHTVIVKTGKLDREQRAVRVVLQGKTVGSVKELKSDDILDIRFFDGKANAKIQEIKVTDNER